MPYASLSAHFKCELGRKDDLWSFFFIVMEFLGQELPWRGCKSYLSRILVIDKNPVKEAKVKAFCEPIKALYPKVYEKSP